MGPAFGRDFATAGPFDFVAITGLNRGVVSAHLATIRRFHMAR